MIAIIGLLSSVILAATNAARANARDAKRNEDAEQLINAFALAYTDEGSFPIPVDPAHAVCVSSNCDGSYTYPQDPTVAAYLAPYLPTLPSDPSENADGSEGYLYIYDHSTDVYLQWQLESADGTCAAGAYAFLWYSATTCVYDLAQ